MSDIDDIKANIKQLTESRKEKERKLKDGIKTVRARRRKPKE